MDEKTLNVTLGVIFFIALIIGGIFMSLYFKWIPNTIFDKKNEIAQGNETIQVNYFDMKIDCPIGTTYIIRAGGYSVTGTMNPNSVEIVKNLNDTQKYTLYCYGNDLMNPDTHYYLNSKECFNQTKCTLTLEKQGKVSKTDYEISFNNIDYNIYVENGILKNILFCIAWKGFSQISSELDIASVPEEMQYSFDRCYYAGTISDKKTVNIKFVKSGKDNEMRFVILDQCNIGADESYDCSGEIKFKSDEKISIP